MSLKSLVQRGLIQLAITGLLLVAAGWQAVEWTINRIYVPVGYSLLLQYKGPLLFGKRVEPEPGQLAKRRDDGTLEIGVLMEMPGPGRHFYCPVWWDRKLVQDQVVAPGEVGIVTSKVGRTSSATAPASSSSKEISATPRKRGFCARSTVPARTA